MAAHKWKIVTNSEEVQDLIRDGFGLLKRKNRNHLQRFRKTKKLRHAK